MVTRMNALTREALKRPEVIRHYGENGATPWWTTPEDYVAYRRRQAEELAVVVKASGARVE
jgi:tripartite-type tricarboxylate transporter receptor subunit TctC